MWREILFAGLGGFIGSVLRYLTGKGAAALHLTSFPAATLTVNLLGCLLIGIFWGLFDKTRLSGASESAFLIAGLCGGFTTFSSFADEIWRMTDRGAWLTAIMYLSVSVIFGILLVAAGRYLVK